MRPGFACGIGGSLRRCATRQASRQQPCSATSRSSLRAASSISHFASSSPPSSMPPCAPQPERSSSTARERQPCSPVRDVPAPTRSAPYSHCCALQRLGRPGMRQIRSTRVVPPQPRSRAVGGPRFSRRSRVLRIGVRAGSIETRREGSVPCGPFVTDCRKRVDDARRELFP